MHVLLRVLTEGEMVGCDTRYLIMVLVGSRPAVGRLLLDCRKANEFHCIIINILSSKLAFIWR
jgi:hypothetical protein